MKTLYFTILFTIAFGLVDNPVFAQTISLTNQQITKALSGLSVSLNETTVATKALKGQKISWNERLAYVSLLNKFYKATILTDKDKSALLQSRNMLFFLVNKKI